MRSQGEASSEMQKRLAIAAICLVLVVLAGALLFYSAYYNSFYAVDRANALFSRGNCWIRGRYGSVPAAGPGTSSKSGNPVWWFPTDKTDFTEVQKDIDSIIVEPNSSRVLPRDGTAYQQGMDDLRGNQSVRASGGRGVWIHVR